MITETLTDTLTDRESFALLIRGYLQLSRIQRYLFCEVSFDVDAPAYRLICDHICGQFVTAMTWNELQLVHDIWYDLNK